MKKQLLSCGVLILSLGAIAQNKIDFEDLNLAPNSHYTGGADSAGKFVSGGITFPNIYNPSFGGYWSNAYKYSNSKNDTTAGYTNDYSAITAIGGAGSATYATVFGKGTLDFGKTIAIQSIDLTNTTYAYLSMKNGDAFAKKFGTVNNAGGTPDGTNGADFFNVTIIGYNAAGVRTDSVMLDLADFRFTDNSKDFILKAWKTIDLTKLGSVRSISFKYASSDVGQYGINTPTYVAIDNIAYGYAGLNTLSSSTVNAFPNPFENTLNFGSLAGDLSVVDITGKAIFVGSIEANEALNTTEWLSGVYIATIISEGTVYRATIVKK